MVHPFFNACEIRALRRYMAPHQFEFDRDGAPLLGQNSSEDEGIHAPRNGYQDPVALLDHSVPTEGRSHAAVYQSLDLQVISIIPRDIRLLFGVSMSP